MARAHRNGKTKLTPEQINWIRENIVVPPGRQRLKRGVHVVGKVAKEFGVTKETIWNVISGRTWAVPTGKGKHNG
jgi:hypothetical protein